MNESPNVDNRIYLKIASKLSWIYLIVFATIMPMKELNPSDLFEVRPQALFSSNDYEYLVDLYAPIIGIKSVAVLLALLHVNQEEIMSHKSFLKRNKITISDLSEALEGLEAIGLVSTFRKSEQNYQYFVYCVYSPRTPKEFFDNVLFAGTLEKAIGEEEANAIARKYQVSSLPEDMDNSSTTFQEYFNPDYEDPIYQNAERVSGGRTIGKVSTGFDRNSFMKSIRELDPRFNFDSFSKVELVKIARISALYNFEESSMASFVRESFAFSKKIGERVNFTHLSKIAGDSYKYSYLRKGPSKSSQAHGDSDAAKSIRRMERMTPIEYLTVLQKGNKPAKPDINLINTLTIDMGLPGPVCNALVLYVLINNGNTLPGAYTEKLAGTLIREGIETALDAMNYFTQVKEDRANKTPKKAKPTSNATKAVEVETEPESPKGEISMSQEEIDDFLENIDFGD